MTKCPVCEMPVEDDETEITSEFNGRKYYFCSTGCQEEFDYNQEKYLKNLYLEDEPASEDGDSIERTDSADDL